MFTLKVEIPSIERQRWRALSAAAASIVLGVIALAGSSLAMTIPSDLNQSVSEDERDFSLRRRGAMP